MIISGGTGSGKTEAFLLPLLKSPDEHLRVWGIRLLTENWPIDALHTTDSIAGATGRDSITYIYPTMMNAFLGTKFKVVPGYKSSTEVDLAMQRGEAQGKIFTWGSLKSERSLEWLTSGKVKIITQIGLDKAAA